ncbi:RagB/SusD family nutrient uptake outer membrane protein [Bacteroides sp. 519]|uniref:RagB/SusD family nutrient uptake outer membrane protein n=1 Tax=Bacteroides sp. 519 TaxID=2302937 RepID=UPI0013D2E667|nr:RagB/SusD family nutrient uptake outer membrane protein [Bacteroides sp. 519]NDV60344.1 RagB/SusD family nutrient uptake outer membrane protein [Bacteroides sp. 519]
MKTIKYLFVAAALSLTVTSCYDMDLEPKGLIYENGLFISDNGIKKYFALIYQDMPIEDFNYKQNGDNKGFATVNQGGWHTGNKWEAQKGSPASAAGEATGREPSYGDGWGYWNYDRIRDINYFIEAFPKYREYYKEDEYNAHLGEAYFLRAFYYFGIVKRYGGVPIVDKVLDPKAPTEELQQPRNTEYDCWKFIYSDLKFAMENASTDKKELGRANRYAAAALMSRAMLYAGSIAKYGGYIGTKGPAVSAGLMGMPADKAQEFFQYSYEAGKFLKQAGYKLHTGADKEKAYLEVFIGDNEDEDIFIKQYGALSSTIPDVSLFHSWDTMVLPIGEGLANSVGCALQPVWEQMGLYQMPAIIDEDGKPVRFDRIEDLWDNDVMEPRARATFFFPGMTETASGVKLDIQGGVYKAYPGLASDGTADTQASVNDYTNEYRVRASKPGENQEINGQKVKVNGNHGLAEGTGDEGYTRTGAFIRKYVNFNAASGTRVLHGSTQSWKVFRYGEILCNMAEAAYELGLAKNDEALKTEAFEYVNEIRDRAGANRHNMVENPEDVGSPIYGFPIDENLQYIRDERARELCYENHRLYDIRRWRVADIMFQNGAYTHTLLPYYVLNEDKYIFLNEVEREGRKVNFEKRWYYEQIPGGEIGKNPNLIRNDGY